MEESTDAPITYAPNVGVKRVLESPSWPGCLSTDANGEYSIEKTAWVTRTRAAHPG